MIAGIVFLGVEIHQNTNSLDSQLRFSQSERVTEVFEELFRNNELGEAFLAYLDGDSLTALQDLKLSVFAQRVFISWQWLYGESVRGATSQDFVQEFRRAFHRGPTADRDNALYRDYWGRAKKESFDPGFVQWMEENVVNEG